MIRPVAGGAVDRPFHLVEWVEIEILLRTYVRKMRSHERDPKAPRLAASTGFVLDPAHGLIGDRCIKPRVLRLADAGVLHVFDHVSLRGHRLSRDSEQIADALLDVHDDAFVRKPVVVFHAAKVHLADDRERYPLVGQPVSPAGSRACIWGCVVPVSRFRARSVP